MKKITITLSVLMFFVILSFAGSFRYGTTLLVDGKLNSDQVVISRNPIITWEYTGSVSSFTVTVSESPTFAPSIWSYTSSPNTSNTTTSSNYKMTRVAYNADSSAVTLNANKTYYIKVELDDNGTIETTSSQFSTQSSEITLGSAALELAVDWNNPFNPWKGEYTKFRFVVRDQDRKVKLRIFSLSGDLVKEYTEQALIKDGWSTLTWDGRNNDGDMVARGIYIANLVDVGDQRSKSVTKRLAVVR